MERHRFLLRFQIEWKIAWFYLLLFWVFFPLYFVLCSVAFGLNCICSQNCNIQTKQQAMKCICSMKYRHTHITIPYRIRSYVQSQNVFLFRFLLVRSFSFIYLYIFFVSVDSFKRMMVNHLFGWEKMQLSIKHIHRWNNNEKTHTQNLVCWIDYYDATRKWAANEREGGKSNNNSCWKKKSVVCVMWKFTSPSIKRGWNVKTINTILLLLLIMCSCLCVCVYFLSDDGNLWNWLNFLWFVVAAAAILYWHKLTIKHNSSANWEHSHAQQMGALCRH